MLSFSDGFSAVMLLKHVHTAKAVLLPVCFASLLHSPSQPLKGNAQHSAVGKIWHLFITRSKMFQVLLLLTLESKERRSRTAVSLTYRLFKKEL